MKTPQIPAPVSRRRFIGQLSAAAAGISLLPHRIRAADAPSPGRKLGIALVGLGNYATNMLAPAIRHSNSWRIAGVVTGSPEKGLKWARRDGFPEKNVLG